jgi:hypothetical protein
MMVGGGGLIEVEACLMSIAGLIWHLSRDCVEDGFRGAPQGSVMEGERILLRGRDANAVRLVVLLLLMPNVAPRSMFRSILNF